MNYKVNLRAYFMLAPAPKLLVAALPGVPFYTVISNGRSINFVMYGDAKVEHIFTLVSYGKDRFGPVFLYLAC